MSKQEVFDPDQGHGNHFDCITYENERDRMIGMLPQLLDTAKVVIPPAADVPCNLGDGYPSKVTCVMVADSNDPVHVNILIGCGINNDHHEIFSFYPEMTGAEVMVELTHIYEWSNGLEATLAGNVCNGQRQIAFFDTRYFAHKGKYEIGKVYKFRLGAFAERCEIVKELTFKFEGQKAVDFRAKTGEAPQYDENGNVKPVEFDISQMVAFLQTSNAHPHIAEFQSPVSAISILKEWDREYYSIEITIASAEEENAGDVRIPLLAKTTFFPEMPPAGTPVRGIIYLMGYLA